MILYLAMQEECGKISKAMEEILSPERAGHCKSVAREAVALARRYGADPEKAELAALLHDLCREDSPQVLNEYVRQRDMDSAYIDNRNLAHGKVAAILAEEVYGITDGDILNAIAYHTTGRAGMSLLEKVLFLADAIEPGRTYPGVEALRRLALEDLDRACLMALERTINYLRSRGKYLDRDTLRARDDLKRKEGR